MKQLALSFSRSLSQYQILYAAGLLSSPKAFDGLVMANNIGIISNGIVAPIYLQTLLKNIKSVHSTGNYQQLILPDGEQYKNFESFQLITDFLIEKSFRRNDLLIALGGGVIGDITGFASACYQRGINFIQIPTSLLAMVDSSIGGKTAINHVAGKNMIGAFHQPLRVLVDFDCLQTLPKEEFQAGMAEIIKAAIIYDASFFAWITNNSQAINALDKVAVEQMVIRACEIKAAIVSQDETEKGIRAYLNLGHTFAHAIERQLGYGKILHGQAVAIGTVLATKLNHQQNKLSTKDLANIIECFKLFSLPTELPKAVNPQLMIDDMSLDKKNLDKNLRLILPIAIGQVTIDDHYTRDDIAKFLTNIDE